MLTATNGSVTTVSVTTNGGAASGDNDGGGSVDQAHGANAGSISLIGTNVVINGDYNAVGGVGVGRDSSSGAGFQGVGGSGGIITITANTTNLNNNINASGGAIYEGSAVGADGTVSIILNGANGSASIGHSADFTTEINVSVDAGATGSQTLISTSTFDGLEWFIDGAGKGSWRDNSDSSALNLVFTSIENVTGGANGDVFNITQTGSVAGIIDGGSGTNTLERSNTSGSNIWLINGTDTGTLNGTSFNQIQTLTGSTVNDDFSFTSASANVNTINGGTGNNSLTARDADNEWHLTSTNGGILYQDNADVGFGASYVDSFTDIQTLIGSDTHIDNFVMGTGSSITSIDGGIG